MQNTALADSAMVHVKALSQDAAVLDEHAKSAADPTVGATLPPGHPSAQSLPPGHPSATTLPPAHPSLPASP
jgi:hypothetical protein